MLRRTHGKDNRVLHSAKLSQGLKVGPGSRTWQGAGISARSTKIGVNGAIESRVRTASHKIDTAKASTDERPSRFPKLSLCRLDFNRLPTSAVSDGLA
jgi:hypothetical protein